MWREELALRVGESSERHSNKRYKELQNLNLNLPIFIEDVKQLHQYMKQNKTVQQG